MLDNLIQNVTKEIDTKTNIKQLNIHSQFIKKQAHHPIDQGFKFLQGFNRLNQLTLQEQSFSIQQLLVCESEQPSFSFYTTTPLFCYKFCKDTTYTSKNVSLINHVNGYYSLLNSIFLPISLSEFQKTMFFTFQMEQEYFAILPPKIVPNSYLPSEREWYSQQEEQIKLLKKNDTQVISDIYQDFETKKYEFTLTIGLTDSNNNKQGIFGIDQSLENYKELLIYPDLNVIVVDLKGRMLLSNLIVEQNIDLSIEEKYIYEKNITGFDDNDWKEMISEAKQQGLGISECQNFLIDKQFWINNNCNQYREQFLFTCSLAHIIVNIENAQNLQNKIFEDFQQLLFFYLGAGLFLLTISLMIIPIFFKPFKNIQQIMQTQMAQKYTIHYDHIFFSNRKKNQLSFFQESFNVFKQKLLDFAQSKSQDCYLFENFKYPRQCQLINKDLTSFISTQLNNKKIHNDLENYPKFFFDSAVIVSQKNLKSNKQLSPKEVTFRTNF